MFKCSCEYMLNHRFKLPFLRQLLFSFILTLIISCGNYTKFDYALHAGLITETLVDWHQSGKYRGVVDSCSESNPIIGSCGERIPLNVYIPVTIGVMSAVAIVLPPRFRTYFLGFVGIGEGYVIFDNARLHY